MKQSLETIELAALRIATDSQLPDNTARHLNVLLKSLVFVLNRHTQEIERLHATVQKMQGV
jgi:hypothetical protein